MTYGRKGLHHLRKAVGRWREAQAPARPLQPYHKAPTAPQFAVVPPFRTSRGTESGRTYPCLHKVHEGVLQAARVVSMSLVSMSLDDPLPIPRPGSNAHKSPTVSVGALLVYMAYANHRT